MEKKKIANIITYVILIFLILNAVIALISYNEVSKKKTPTISFGVSKKGNETIYNELLYSVKVKEEEMVRTVSLKLFFLK